MDELAVQRAFKGKTPYDKSLEKIKTRLAELTGLDRACYNTKENVAE